MDLNRLNPTQYIWIITKTNKPLDGLAYIYVITTHTHDFSKCQWTHINNLGAQVLTET
jgi:hypothetical protein